MASLSSALYTCSNAFSYISSHPSSQNPPTAVIPLARSSFICHSSKKKTNFTDQILDYIEVGNLFTSTIPEHSSDGPHNLIMDTKKPDPSGHNNAPTIMESATGFPLYSGPKLRKWYGAPDLLPKDVDLVEEDETPEAEEIRDAVLVTDGDGDIGQMIILSLILKRARIKALVKDKKASVEAFGTYVEPIARDRSDQKFLTKALRGVRAVICPSNEGFLSDVRSMNGVQHLIFLSQLAVYKGSSGIQALMNSSARKLAERDEAAVVASGIPYTIIRAGLLQNRPGGEQGFCFEEGSAEKGKISKEDAALICVEALNAVPEKGLVFEVVNGGEKVSDWKECFSSLLKNSGKFIDQQTKS